MTSLKKKVVNHVIRSFQVYYTISLLAFSIKIFLNLKVQFVINMWWFSHRVQNILNGYLKVYLEVEHLTPRKHITNPLIQRFFFSHVYYIFELHMKQNHFIQTFQHTCLANSFLLLVSSFRTSWRLRISSSRSLLYKKLMIT